MMKAEEFCLLGYSGQSEEVRFCRAKAHSGLGPPVSKNWLALLEQRWAVSPQPEEGPESPLLLEEKAGF